MNNYYWLFSQSADGKVTVYGHYSTYKTADANNSHNNQIAIANTTKPKVAVKYIEQILNMGKVGAING